MKFLKVSLSVAALLASTGAKAESGALKEELSVQSIQVFAPWVHMQLGAAYAIITASLCPGEGVEAQIAGDDETAVLSLEGTGNVDCQPSERKVERRDAFLGDQVFQEEGFSPRFKEILFHSTVLPAAILNANGDG